MTEAQAVFAYLIRRIAWACVLFIATTFVTYIIFFMVPADPAALVCGRNCDAKEVARTAHFLGTDQPVYVQYGRFMKRLVVDHSLGRSFATRQDVNDIVASAAPVTGSLVLGGVVLYLLLAVPLGIFSALKPRSLLDRAGMVLVLVGISAHPVWIGLILAYFFGFKFGITPITGYCDAINPGTDCGGVIQWAYHLILPWVTFALVFAALYTRLIRAQVMETMNEDYVRTARAKGASEWIVMRSHILRNAMLIVVTQLGLDVGLALGGALFTESVFGLPGLGKVAIESITSFDLPITQGVVVFGMVAIITFNLAVDLLYAWIDPRIRLS
jgi:peptide/nickel transport system permease protein